MKLVSLRIYIGVSFKIYLTSNNRLWIVTTTVMKVPVLVTSYDVVSYVLYSSHQ